MRVGGYMKGIYKGCEIEVTREKSITGEKMLFYIDDYKDHTEDYEN